MIRWVSYDFKEEITEIEEQKHMPMRKILTGEWEDYSRYPGEKLRQLRAERGVGKKRKIGARDGN